MTDAPTHADRPLAASGDGPDLALAAPAVARSLVRVGSVLVIAWSLVGISVDGAYCLAQPERDRWTGVPLVLTYTLRLLVGVAALLSTDALTRRMGLGGAGANRFAAEAWTPAASVRVGAAVAGAWALLLACWPLAEFVRAVTGWGVPPLDAGPWYESARPNLPAAALSFVIYGAGGLLLFVAPGRYARRARALERPTAESLRPFE